MALLVLELPSPIFSFQQQNARQLVARLHGSSVNGDNDTESQADESNTSSGQVRKFKRAADYPSFSYTEVDPRVKSYQENAFPGMRLSSASTALTPSSS